MGIAACRPSSPVALPNVSPHKDVGRGYQMDISDVTVHYHIRSVPAGLSAFPFGSFAAGFFRNHLNLVVISMHYILFAGV